jgi:hypothetical protein
MPAQRHAINRASGTDHTSQHQRPHRDQQATVEGQHHAGRPGHPTHQPAGHPTAPGRTRASASTGPADLGTPGPSAPDPQAHTGGFAAPSQLLDRPTHGGKPAGAPVAQSKLGMADSSASAHAA